MSKFFEWQAEWLKEQFGAEAQLRMWICIFWLCKPLYFTPLIFGGSWLTIFIFWLSVFAIDVSAMTGITAAETLVETRTEPSLQEAVNGGASTDDDDGADQGPLEASSPATEAGEEDEP